MRIKMLIAAAAITVSGVLATGASAANLTPTTVTIQAVSPDSCGKRKIYAPHTTTLSTRGSRLRPSVLVRPCLRAR